MAIIRKTAEEIRQEMQTPEAKASHERLAQMTDEEIRAGALSDPDAQPLTEEELSRFKPAKLLKLEREAREFLIQLEGVAASPVTSADTAARIRELAGRFEAALVD